MTTRLNGQFIGFSTLLKETITTNSQLTACNTVRDVALTNAASYTSPGPFMAVLVRALIKALT